MPNPSDTSQNPIKGHLRPQEGTITRANNADVTSYSLTNGEWQSLADCVLVLVDESCRVADEFIDSGTSDAWSVQSGVTNPFTTQTYLALQNPSQGSAKRSKTGP